MAQSRQADESKAASEEEKKDDAHKRLREHAERLQKSVAWLISQAEKADTSLAKDVRLSSAKLNEASERVHEARIKLAKKGQELAAAGEAAMIEQQKVNEATDKVRALENIAFDANALPGSVEQQNVDAQRKILIDLQEAAKQASQAQLAIGQQVIAAEKARDAAIEKETEEKKAEEKAVREAVAAKAQPLVPHVPPVIHPLTAYGYDARGGGLKQLISEVNEVVDKVAGYIPPSAGEEVKAGDFPSEAQAFKKLFDDFENHIRKTQNGWMMGQPVEPDVLKSAAKKLDKDIRGDKWKGKISDDDLQSVRDKLALFSARVDKEIDRLQDKATKRANSNASLVINQNIHDEERNRPRPKTRTEKVKEFFSPKKPEGKCVYLELDMNDIQNLSKNSNDPLWQKLWQPSTDEPKRAYILAKNVNAVFYVDGTTGEMTEVNISHEQRERLRTQDEISPDDRFNVDNPLTSRQEAWIREITGHRVDKEYGTWQETVPYQSGDKEELKKRRDDQIECIALCDGDKHKGETMARNKALERLENDKLESHKDQEVLYDSGGAKFNVSRKKDKEGGTVFSIQYHDGDNHCDPKAMASLVELCHKHNPLSAVELDCEELSSNRDDVQKVLKQLTQAINAAEAADQEGRFTAGVLLGPNAKKVLAMTGNTELQQKADLLYAKWKAKTAEKHAKQKHEASTKYSTEKGDGLGALLTQTDVSQFEHGLGGGQAELTKAFKIKGDTPDDQAKRLAELKTECQKLDMKVQQLDVAAKSITDQLYVLENDIKKAADAGEGYTLEDIAQQLDNLKAAQETVNAELEKIARPPAAPQQAAAQDNQKETGLAENYKGWINKVDQSGLVGRTPEVRATLNSLNERVNRAQEYAKNLLNVNVPAAQQQAQAAPAGNNNAPQNNLSKMGELKKEVEHHRNAIKQKQLAEKSAEDRAGPRPGG